MKLKHRFTYAGTVRTVGRRVKARRAPGMKMPADWKSLAVSESRTHGQAHSLNLPMRILITAALVGICIAVISKEPALHDQMATALGSAGEEISGWFDKPSSAATQPAPGERIGTEAKPVVVETGPAEFRPVALVSDGGIFALGDRGEVKTCGPECTAERFPVVTGLKVQEVPGTMGVMLKTNADMSLIHAVLRTAWVDQLSEINLGELPVLVLYTRDAVKIKLNADSQLDQNLKRLAAVLKDLRGRGQDAFTVDVRYKDQIVVKPRLILEQRRGFGGEAPQRR